MVIITEPISYTLRTLCSSSSLPRMDMVEVKKCVYDVTDGLYFLHDAARMVHRRICPDTIFCTDKGEWKIGGFGFSYPADSPEAPLDIREIESNPNTDIFQFIGNTEFLSPEMMTGLVASPASDMYALGRLALYMMAHTDDVADQITESGRSESEIYKSRIDRLQMDSVRAEFLRPLLLSDPSIRSSADSFLRSGYFQDTNTRVLLYLKNFVQQDDSNKQQFLKGLHKSLHTFSQRIICQHVLPPLVLEIKNGKIAAPVLANVFHASQSISNDEFNKIVVPHIGSLYKATSVLSHAVLVVLLENLAIVFNKVKPEIATNYLIGFLIRALSTDKIEVVGEALNQLPLLIENPAMTMEAIRSGVLPRLQYICQNASSEQLRVRTLACFAKLVPIMERYLTLEFVMPSLTHLSQSDRSLPISVALITVYEVVVQQFDADLLAQKLLPSLLPLSVDKDINIDQFNVVMRIVRMAIDKLEQLRSAELSKKKVDTVVPLAESESTNPREWESFEQTQKRILAIPATAPKVNLSTSQTTISPTPTPPTPYSTNQNIIKPLPSSVSPPISHAPSITAPAKVIPISPTQQQSSGNLFAGLETKKQPMNTMNNNNNRNTNNSDPFGSLGELQEQIKRYPPTTITPTKPTNPVLSSSLSSNTILSPTPLIPSSKPLTPSLSSSSLSSNANTTILSPTPLIPSPKPITQNSPKILTPSPTPLIPISQTSPLTPSLTPLVPSPTLSPTPAANNTPSNFSLSGLNVKPTSSPQAPLSPAEPFGTNLSSFIDY